MALTPEIVVEIKLHPLRNSAMIWRHDTVGTVVRDLIDQDKQLSGITPNELNRLMELLRLQTEEYGTASMKVGKVDIYIGGREIRVGINRWLSSANIPGLFARGDVPLQPEAHNQAADQINALLTQMGHAPQVAAGARIRGINYREDFETTELTIETPECKGTYHLFANYAHRPAALREIQSNKTAMLIDLRIKNRRYILEQRRETEKNVAKYLEPVAGMKVIGSVYNIDDYSSRKNQTLRGNAYAEVEMLGDTLKPQVVMASDRDEAKTLKALIAKHRANYKQLGGRKPSEALMCEPILAAAIRAVAAEHGKGLLKEIESALAGKYSPATNPRRRGIANISVNRGEVRAPVTLLNGKDGVRFLKERLNVKSIKQLPQIMLQSLPGRKLRDVVDHPFMEGLVIKSVTVNTAGLQIRPEPAQVPLEDVLTDLHKAGH